MMPNMSTRAEPRLDKPKLVYPFESVPGPAEAMPVAPGVMWLRMPMPMQLDHINLWAIEDGNSWAVVDTGMRTDQTLVAWRQLLSKGTDGRRVGRVFATHMHPDHVGMAGWLTRKFDCALWMTRTEYLNCRVLAADTGREAPAEAIRFYRRAGWGDAAIEDYRARFGKFGQFIHALPDSYRRIRDGETLRIGEHDWRVVVGTGHSPEHACLYGPELRLLISGDQVLPRISSNVSVHPTEPEADPLSDWLASIEKLKAEVPDDVLVLPAHNEPFRGLHARLDHLAQGHHRSLARLLKTLDQPKRVIDVFGALFARAVDPAEGSMQLGLASGESIASLNYLVNRGEVRREIDAGGVAWYRRVAA
jgi:glyoxylase-like metal-dependent hydrolase (beta-lactamase superfamily II)